MFGMERRDGVYSSVLLNCNFEFYINVVFLCKYQLTFQILLLPVSIETKETLKLVMQISAIFIQTLLLQYMSTLLSFHKFALEK